MHRATSSRRSRTRRCSRPASCAPLLPHGSPLQAISLALGIIANAALILRFLERRVYESTIVACLCLTFHDCLNIAMLVAFGVIHAVDDGFTCASAAAGAL